MPLPSALLATLRVFSCLAALLPVAAAAQQSTATNLVVTPQYGIFSNTPFNLTATVSPAAAVSGSNGIAFYLVQSNGYYLNPPTQVGFGYPGKDGSVSVKLGPNPTIGGVETEYDYQAEYMGSSNGGGYAPSYSNEAQVFVNQGGGTDALEGWWAFKFQGFTTLAPGGPGVVGIIGHFGADREGNVNSGTIDVSVPGKTYIELPITGSYTTYENYSFDGTQCVLTLTSSMGTQTFMLNFDNSNSTQSLSGIAAGGGNEYGSIQMVSSDSGLYGELSGTSYVVNLLGQTAAPNSPAFVTAALHLGGPNWMMEDNWTETDGTQVVTNAGGNEPYTSVPVFDGSGGHFSITIYPNGSSFNPLSFTGYQIDGDHAFLMSTATQPENKFLIGSISGPAQYANQ